MSNQPTLEHNQHAKLEWIVINLAFYAFLLFSLGPITTGIAFYYKRRQATRKTWLILLTVSLIWGILIWVSDGLQIDGGRSISWFWFLSMPLFMPAAVVLKGFGYFSEIIRPKSLQEKLSKLEQKSHLHDRKTSARASKVQEIEVQPGKLRLGVTLKGDWFPDGLGIEHNLDWLCLSEEVLDQHIFLLGTTGAGKSETIKRLVNEILTATDRNIYFVDGKGDEGLANDIRSMAFHHGRGIAPIFKLGFDKNGAVYHGLNGGKADIYNRLCALVGIQEAEGDAQYYADINRDLLQLICYSPDGPPRNFETIRTRLNKQYLLDAYQFDDLEYQTVENEISTRDIQSLLRRIRPLMREFRTCIGDEGFSLEQVRCAIFSMRVQSVGDTSKRFLDFLVEDLKDFIGKRQKHPSVLIIDEFGQFNNTNITALLSLARSSKLGVVLATQDVASLKDEATKRLVLANARTKILMATDFPEEVAGLAGTIYQIESSFQHDSGDTTGLGSARIQHTFKVDMNEAAQLQPGEAFLIRQRHAAKIKIRAIGNVTHIEEQREELREPGNAGGTTNEITLPNLS